MSSPMAKHAQVGTLSHHPGGKPHITSEKHDILYSKARYVLHQRHIKRPWFNLNPFLEKTDETLDLDNFLPEESKYIQRLESLVLCESYSKDMPLDTRELTLEKFFEYLNSDQWQNGCSIRVLDGQLLDQLLIGLYRLERENVATRHTTYAFARNNRHITGCYKLANTEFYGARDETLLMEFAYFGRLTKEKSNTKTQRPMDYLQEEMAGQSDYIPFSNLPVLPPLQQKSSTKVKRQSREQVIHSNRFYSEHLSDSSKIDSSKRRCSFMPKSPNDIGVLSPTPPQNRRKSVAIMSGTMSSYGTPISSLRTLAGPQEKRRENVVFTTGEPKRRFRQTSVAVVGAQFLMNKQKKTSIAHGASPSFHEEEDSSVSSDTADMTDEDDTSITTDGQLYGHEFYLSDANVDQNTAKESTLEKVQRKKKEIQKRRTDLKYEREEMEEYQKKHLLPPLQPLDFDKIQEHVPMHRTIKLPDELPTFEEFVQLLKADEYFDPRYRNKVRLKSKIITKRYYIAKGVLRPSATSRPEHVTDSSSNERSTKTYGPVKGQQKGLNGDRYLSNGLGIKDNAFASVMQDENLGTRQIKDLSNASINSCQRFAEVVKGVTDSRPCKEHCLKSLESITGSPEENPKFLRRNQNVKKKGSRGNIAFADNCLKQTASLRTGRVSATMFPKAELCDEDRESPDTESEESVSETETPCLFDGRKVNPRYSVERLKKKRRQKKKKPVFMEILSKYYNTHTALKAFRTTGSTVREEKTTRDKLKRIVRMHKGEAKPPAIQEFVIGKLRRFSFNNAKPKKKLNLEGLSRGEFSKPDLTSFHEELRKAIEEFVVRREIVVSDKQTFYRSATSVTFTRKTCFQNNHIDN